MPKNAPTAIEPFLRSLWPFILTAHGYIDAAYPYLEKAWSIGEAGWKVVAPYREDFLPIVSGFILIFFGGSIPLTIAAVEAFRLCGWEKSKASLIILFEQYKAGGEGGWEGGFRKGKSPVPAVEYVAVAASNKDNLKDEDGDGVPDVQQIDAKQLLTRKVALFLKVTDPDKLQDAVTGITAGLTAVIATLQLEFAQTITLGVSLGDMFVKATDKVLRPTLLNIIPKEHHKWIPLLISFSCRAVAIHIAWWSQRVISALHSSTRGSDMLLHGAFALAERYKINVPFNLSLSHPSYPAIMTAVAVFGFYAQLARGFGLPFPMNILLLPLRILEFVLSWTVAYGPK